MGSDTKDKKGKILKWIGTSIGRKIAAAVLIVILAALAAVGIRDYVSHESDTVKIGFEDIGEMATQAAYCTEVNVTDESRQIYGFNIPFTQSKYIYSYDVVVKAGIDFDEIEWSLEEQEIRVKLPKTKILSCEIDEDSFEVYHEKESIFKQITLEDNNDARMEMKENAEKDAIEKGILENARTNAENILTGFFGKVYDLSEYTIVFTDK